MAGYRRFTDMKVWNAARILTKDIYVITSCHSLSRDWALRDQLRKAAVSIPSNIAEGFERGGTGEFIQFLSVAKGSNGEVITQLHIALDLGYLQENDFQELVGKAHEVGAMLGGLIKYLRKSGITGSKYRK